MSKILFLGAGKMATAIAGGIVRAGLFQPEELAAFDISEDAATAFRKQTSVGCETGNCREMVTAAECILIALKPQTLPAALENLRPLLAEKAVLSIAAGVPIARLMELTGSKRVVRIMPNTPALIGEGAAAFAPSPSALPEDRELARKIFSAVGVALQCDEHLLDAVTALSGSGPAYVFEFIQALSDGGVAAGLPRASATELALQTVIGAAEMVRRTGEHPTVLKDQVTSPGGTTIRALEVLEQHAFAGTIIAAVRAAAERSEELGRAK